MLDLEICFQLRNKLKEKLEKKAQEQDKLNFLLKRRNHTKENEQKRLKSKKDKEQVSQKAESSVQRAETVKNETEQSKEASMEVLVTESIRIDTTEENTKDDLAIEEKSSIIDVALQEENSKDLLSNDKSFGRDQHRDTSKSDTQQVRTLSKSDRFDKDNSIQVKELVSKSVEVKHCAIQTEIELCVKDQRATPPKQENQKKQISLEDVEAEESSTLLLESSIAIKSLETTFETLLKSRRDLTVIDREESISRRNDLRSSEYEYKLQQQRKQINLLLEKTRFLPVSKKDSIYQLKTTNLVKQKSCFPCSSGEYVKRCELLLTDQYLIFGKNQVKLVNCEVKAVKNPNSFTGFEVRLTEKSDKKIYRFAPNNLDETVQWSKAMSNNIKFCKQQAKEEEKVEDEDLNTFFDDFDIALQTSFENASKSYYDLLNIRTNDDLDVLKKNYRNLAMQYHPDKLETTEIDYEEFNKVAKAYQVLKVDSLRKEYNLYLDVKFSLRLGIFVHIHMVQDISLDGDSDSELPSAENKFWGRQTLFIDDNLRFLIFQPEKYGSILNKDCYRVIQLRYISKIVAGDNLDFLNEPGDNWSQGRQLEAKKVFIVSGKRKGCDDFLIELDTNRNRDDLMDGLRYIRSESSMLFKQNLDKMISQGLR